MRARRGVCCAAPNRLLWPGALARFARAVIYVSVVAGRLPKNPGGRDDHATAVAWQLSNEQEYGPSADGRGWVRTSDLSRVKRARRLRQRQAPAIHGKRV